MVTAYKSRLFKYKAIVAIHYHFCDLYPQYNEMYNLELLEDEGFIRNFGFSRSGSVIVIVERCVKRFMKDHPSVLFYPPLSRAMKRIGNE